MYSNVDSDDIFASAMEDDAEFVENPFVEGGDGEPLHAVDAARRLLGNDDEDDAPSNERGNQGPSNSMGNSLLERIQQQKKQKNTPVSNANINQNSSDVEQADNGQFGYPMVQEGSYSTSGSVRIPEYSQVPSPSPYNTDTTYNISNGESSDYKDKMMTILSAVGSAAGAVATGAYHGTKVLYGKMTSKGNTTIGGGMAEMDYQRASLLMDPHELEDRASPMSGSLPTQNNHSPTGMRAGVIRHSSGNENSFVTFLKQFAVDMKDLYMGASRRVQIGVIVLIIFIIWLIFFE